MTTSPYWENTVPRITALLALCAAITSTAGAASEDNPYKQTLNDRSDSIVVVKFVMNVTMGGGGGGMDREIPVEIGGLVVSDDGLIMIPGAPMDLANQMRRQMRGRRGGRVAAGWRTWRSRPHPRTSAW